MKTKYKNLSLLGWNIHQATGTIQAPIPDMVYDTIVAYAPDLAVLTEYLGYAPNAKAFEKKLQEAGYNVFRTNAPAGQNDTLIIARASYKMTPITEFPNNDRNYYPNYLEVLIEGEGFALTVVGARIRVLCNGNIANDRTFRLKQMEVLNKRLETIGTPCVVIADLNGREKWVKNNVTASEFSIASGGDTFNFKDGFGVTLDYALLKGVKAKVRSSWEFTSNHPEIYPDGAFSSEIPVPWPDHAMLLCDVAVPLVSKVTDPFFEGTLDWDAIKGIEVGDELLNAIKEEMPQGSESHKKAKCKIEQELGISTGRGCTYPYVVRCVAKALTYLKAA